MSNTRILTAIIILAVLLGGLYFFRGKNTTEINVSLSPSGSIGTSATSSAQRIIPDSWKEYRNDTFHFSVAHPFDIDIEEFKESIDTATILFEQQGEPVGFQVFVVPYAEKELSQARIKQDIPSGIQKNTKSVTIDGVQAISFESEDDFLGETREVWIIHNGLLYEITTSLSLDTWLQSILATWRFI